MGGKWRGRGRKEPRKITDRIPLPLVLIVCEGEITEPQYFHGFFKGCDNPRVGIEVQSASGGPLPFVRFAKKLKITAEKHAKREEDPFFIYDSVWCVFDVDEHDHISEAMSMAVDNGIELAISNPCFELWLLLHFRQSPGPQTSDKLQKLLIRELPNYDKHVDFTTYEQGYPEAVKRAAKLADQAELVGDPIYNPSTGVYRLTELIRGVEPS